MKRFLNCLFPIACCLLFFAGCGYAGPEKAVRNELDLIKKLDESTITSFVSYEDLSLSSDQSLDTGEDTTDAVKLFFKDFSYHIDSSTQSKDGITAEVRVSITNIDAKALAKDLCSAIYSHSLGYSSEEDSGDESISAFTLMKECLENNTYEKAMTQATFQLTRQDDVWTIQESAQLEDEIVGGLVSYLADPYLLSPEETLDLTLKPFLDFDAQDWQEYLQISDIFAVGSEQSDTLDELLFDQISRYFDYQITGTAQDGDNAAVTVDITSLDLNAVIQSCLTPLREYGSSTESIRATNEEVNEKTAEILIDALKDNTASSVTSVSVALRNDGHTWDAVLDESFTDALLGNLDAALTSLSEAADTGEETES